MGHEAFSMIIGNAGVENATKCVWDQLQMACKQMGYKIHLFSS